MKQLLALLLFVPSLCLAQSVTLPYNPDVNADSAITSTDLLGLLPIFGGFFTPEEVLIDGMTLTAVGGYFTLRSLVDKRPPKL